MTQISLSRLAEHANIRRANPHRFRHTLATDLLSRGVPIADVAAILGNSVAIVEKHYKHFEKSEPECTRPSLQLRTRYATVT
ncbi:tyrosine-type recombinase/integrase [Bryobacter aggregatus]|uniref:tyrosine-type recombinase/integrase n=1 Tax=Bryobacter aggregatus TaxID=360054 RepID=UPI0009B5C9C3